MPRQPVSASYPMVFKLYAEREEGDALWTEDYESVDILDGTFNVELGAVTPFPADIGRNDALYLGITVNQAPEMAPRVKVSSALRARWAAHAKDVRGENIHPATVSIGDTEVINAQGQWVGDPSGLKGEKGDTGDRGEKGDKGDTGDKGADFDAAADGDLDTFSDWLEILVGTDPTDGASVPVDLDNDGVPDVFAAPPDYRAMTA